MTAPTPIPVNRTPIAASAYDGEVVLQSAGPKVFDVAFTPEAVLESLEPLRRAAERAMAQRRLPPGGRGRGEGPDQG